MFRWSLVIGLFVLSGIRSAQVYGQQIRVLSASVVTADGGPHEWYTVEADPGNSNNLVTCGMMWDAKDNADYGFVYSSQDAGKTWRLALEDKNSKDVSEESCAFGVHGAVYFVADAWKLDDIGEANGFDGGTTRIWVSHDSGQSWSLGTTTGWTDFSASVVDRRPGPNQNRLYIFFNNITSYYSSLKDYRALDELQKPEWYRQQMDQ